MHPKPSNLPLLDTGLEVGCSYVQRVERYAIIANLDTQTTPVDLDIDQYLVSGPVSEAVIDLIGQYFVKRELQRGCVLIGHGVARQILADGLERVRQSYPVVADREGGAVLLLGQCLEVNRGERASGRAEMLVDKRSKTLERQVPVSDRRLTGYRQPEDVSGGQHLRITAAPTA